MRSQPRARASSSARIMAVYSATLLVVRPSGSPISLTTLPSASSITIPMPAGPGLPRAAPSTCAVHLSTLSASPPPQSLLFDVAQQAPTVLADFHGLPVVHPLDQIRTQPHLTAAAGVAVLNGDNGEPVLGRAKAVVALEERRWDGFDGFVALRGQRAGLGDDRFRLLLIGRLFDLQRRPGGFPRLPGFGF